MNKKIIFLIMLAGIFILASSVSAQVRIPNPLNVNNFGDLLLNIAGAVGGLIAALGTIMIIVAGVLYMTSAGSPEKIKTAKTALFYAIIGILIGASAGAIITVIGSVLSAK